MIVKTDTHSREQISKVVQLRANIEGLKLGPGVVERLATEGEKSSLRSVLGLSTCRRGRLTLPPVIARYALQLLTPASILAQLAGRSQIEMEDVGEMNELFLDAKTSASMIEGGGFMGE